jgi:hypothetical protein
MNPILLIPGYLNSGAGHWQSLWEDELPEACRVDMPNGEQPVLGDWIWTLDEAIAACEVPPILVAHSLGCLAVAHWSANHARTIHGALLVAPVNVEDPTALKALRSFRPIPRHTLPFPTILAASSNDAFLSPECARDLAANWGARLVDLGPCGHVNPASGHGPWPRGEALLAELR